MIKKRGGKSYNFINYNSNLQREIREREKKITVICIAEVIFLPL